MTKTGLFRAFAAALILTGLVIGGRVLYTLYRQQQTANAQDKAWEQFAVAAAGQAPGAGATPSAAPSGLPGGVYLKMTLPKVAKDAVAVNGYWNSLKVVNTVHYRDSPGPGQQGNMLIAFHREPGWLDINKVLAGDIIKIEALDHVTYVYQIDYVKIVRANDVSNLRPTTGHDLTLVTCDPPWRDYNRMVFRAHLVQSA